MHAPTDWTNPPRPTITIAGKPQAEHDAAKGGAVIRQAPGDGTCCRVVQQGKTLQSNGSTFHAGDVVHLSPERANELGRKGVVCHPDDFDRVPTRPVTIREDGQTHGARVQGPDYGR